VNDAELARIVELEARNRELVTQCDTHARQKMAFRNRIEALEKAIRKIIYETTHLSALEDDGSHNCRISKDALDQARAALAPETEK
jgi:hypothetical protein